eukprot:3472122-Rhodomonas_salina.1
MAARLSEREGVLSAAWRKEEPSASKVTWGGGRKGRERGESQQREGGGRREKYAKLVFDVERER